MEDTSQRGDVLVRGAMSQVWFAASGCLEWSRLEPQIACRRIFESNIQSMAGFFVLNVCSLLIVSD